MKKSLGPIPPVIVVAGLRFRRRSGLARIAFTFAILAGLQGACSEGTSGSKSLKQKGELPARLVTLTPSSTELVLAVGAGDRLVGIDRFSAELEEVGDLPKLPVVGDFLSPSFEAIARLEPDLVIADELQSKVAKGLEAAKLATLSLPMHRLDDVTRGLRSVGTALGREREAAEAIGAIEEVLRESRARASARDHRARVLIVLDREPKTLAAMVAAGRGSFADELLDVIGAENVLSSAVRYPRISAEQILRGRPDIIIDASPAAGESLDAWSRLAEVPAVAAGRVVPTQEPALTTPSPRLAAALSELERVVYGSSPR